MTRRARLVLLAATAAGLLAVVAMPATAAKRPAVGFAKPVRVDKQVGGSEGFVFWSARYKRLVYTAHLGTTLLLRDGLTGAPHGTADFAATYRNQVPLWTSDDLGKTWHRVDTAGGFFASPAASNGFSDPDLTEDAAGNVYGAGINLANDSLFSSPDGGKTWLTGTPQCHEGDRPWLAGGREGEVFYSTNSQAGAIVVRSTDKGATCSTTSAARRGSGWTGYGKLLYDRKTDTLYQPAVFGQNGLGLARLDHASAGFDKGAPGAFEAEEAVEDTSFNTFWKAVLARDAAGTMYLVWSTNPRGNGTGGCDGDKTPLANDVRMIFSKDGGRHWSKQQVVARTGTTLLQPWVVAGSRGNVAVGWFQYDRVVDPNCAPASAKVGIRTAMLYGVTGGRSSRATVDPVGKPIHLGPICDHGTTCVATGEDRRLGEFFTLALDGNGCVLVATGDTNDVDPVTGGQLPTARPLFVRQDRGPSLTGRTCR